jgi:hypothetical protein
MSYLMRLTSPPRADGKIWWDGASVPIKLMMPYSTTLHPSSQVYKYFKISFKKILFKRKVYHRPPTKLCTSKCNALPSGDESKNNLLNSLKSVSNVNKGNIMSHWQNSHKIIGNFVSIYKKQKTRMFKH